VSKTRESYLADLLAERLTGRETVQSYGGDSDGDEGPAAWGRQTEPFARAAYEQQTGSWVKLAGFIDHPTVPMSGASPDGLVETPNSTAGPDGGVEIKCPNTATHLETVRKGVIPTRHIQQMKWNMCCTRRRWWDFVSFDPRAEKDEYFCRRLEITPDEMASMEMSVFAFVMELEARLAAHQWNAEEQYP
jgi:hypothetical protein